MQMKKRMMAALLTGSLVLSGSSLQVLADDETAPATDVAEGTATEEVSAQAEGEKAVEESQEPAGVPKKAEPAAETEKKTAGIEPEQEAGVLYVSSQGNDAGQGTKESPYATLAKAVEEANKSPQSAVTIRLESDIIMTKCARIADKDITLDGNGWEVSRAEDFETISDNSRSWYQPALIEVTTPGGEGASLRLEDIVLDDEGRSEGTIFAQASSQTGDNTKIVQDAIVAAYGTGEAEADIVLGEKAVLKNYGGMSAVRVTGGASLVMESGSQIYDDSVSDRVRGAAGSVGPAGAVWVQGTEASMCAGASISNVVGRAFYVDGGAASVGGTLQNIQADADMWQGTAGVGVHGRGGSRIVLSSTCRMNAFTAKGDSVLGIYGSDLEMQEGAEITNVENMMALYMDDIGNNYSHKALVNGTVSNVKNTPVMRSWYGHIEIGTTGVVKDCDGDQVLYTNNGSKYTINGTLTGNQGTVVYLANQSGGRVTAEMNAGARIVNNTGVAVRVNNGSLFTMNGGEIAENSTGVQVSGKTNFKGVHFIMNSGVIRENKTGISYTAAGESKVELNGGEISGNGSSYQIFVSGGSASDASEYIRIKAGVLREKASVYTSGGTVTLDPEYTDVTLGKASSAAKDQIEQLLTEKHPTWKLAGSSALWVRPENENYHFKFQVSGRDTSGLYAAYIPLNADGTPEQNAELTLKEVVNEDHADVFMTGLNPEKAYALMLVNNDIYTLSPDDITIYTGGEHYSETHGLPTDYTIDGVDKISVIRFGEEETSYSKYNADDQKKAREDLKKLFTVIYEDEQGQTLTSDKKAGEYVERFELKEGVIDDLKINGNNVEIEDGTLLIRYISDVEEAISGASVKELAASEAELTETVIEHAAGAAVEGSTYYINNDKDREITDTSGIALLDDGLLTSENDGRVELLQRRAEDIVKWETTDEGGKRNYYDFHYLDLVDKNNGNAWVSSSKGTVVYLPYPEGTDQTTTFQLVHYMDLHREYGITGRENVEQAIQDTRIELVEITNEQQGIRFEIPQAGFSPFALVWQGENELPVIYAEDRSITVGERFDPLEGVTAYDEGDGDLTDQILVTENAVNTKKIGKYQVTYQVSDRQGAVATKTIQISVVQKDSGTDDPGKGEDSGAKDSGKKTAVKTGDQNTVLWWICLILLSGGAAVSIYYKRKVNK